MKDAIYRNTWKQFPGEVNSGEIITDPSGFIPAKLQIESMLYAGKILANSRAVMYDTEDPDVKSDDIPLDPFRRPDVDLADVSSAQNYLDKVMRDKSSVSAVDPQDPPKSSVNGVTSPPVDPISPDPNSSDPKK